MAKRTLESFFKPVSPPSTEKRIKIDDSARQSQSQAQFEPQPDLAQDNVEPSTHPTYPIPIPQLPSHIDVGVVHGTPAREPQNITNQPHLDLLYFQPYLSRQTANELFKFLRRELPFYRVQYSIKRGGVETSVNTPRFTTVFGVDDTARFVRTGCPDSKDKDEKSLHGHEHELKLINAQTKAPVSARQYQYDPRPIPACLDVLRQRVEAATGARYNFCLVNYYASGEDSISFHSDDERFLGDQPNIASLSLGGEREFVMKHKPPPPTAKCGSIGIRTGGMRNMDVSDSGGTATKPSQTAGTTNSQHWVAPSHGQMQQQIKMPLASGDMVVMRGDTQSHWLHSIPKRRGRAGDAVRGRINITFRKAVVPAGTNNYYHYNVGSGPVYRWDEGRGVMVKSGES
ncbi:Oxoglutarate/iron-dependent dioxygenase [Penicillium odoratum]|uniref:Oxoglutarate/iron-dependent dioxygenase n=1 Tax=Penicillium odoratum TaxID=1167516 RepID=UPI002548D139|nr:Oxoglutarate/iron-dependent dioxygenase [Penicillium odoratum]KAJ5771658.1 Oxoglutarate/iron-dependent dioxygenase [Penicillium odoratum]